MQLEINPNEPHLAGVLRKHSEGPTTGIFTDGGSTPNPGPGGWGYVHVVDNKIIAQACGHDADTTNNRMELTALIEAFRYLPKDDAVEVYSDSELCVNTVTKWAAGWESKGWKRKTGPIANLDLVKELYQLAKEHPNVSLKWIKAHNGWRWNEYVDGLATYWTRARSF